MTTSAAGTEENPFYVYTLNRPNGVPFYVGMGRGNRVQRHEDTARRGEKSHKANVIRKIWAQGLQVQRSIVERFPTSIEAKAFEVELIRQIGRLDIGAGPLVNLTAGGDGASGTSAEMRRRIGAATRAAMASPDIQEKCRAHMARLRTDPEWAAARENELKDYWKDPANRAAQSERTKRYFESLDDATRKTARARQRAALNSPSVREKMRAAKLGKKQSPEHVEKRVSGQRGKPRPHSGANISAGRRAGIRRRLEATISFD